MLINLQKFFVFLCTLQTFSLCFRVLLTASCLVVFSCYNAWANNLNISNVTVASQDTSANTLTLQFDISWENSWYDSVNHDAAWFFIKYATDGGTVWNHATLNSSGTGPAGFSSGSGTEIEISVPADKTGFFVRRANLGSGTLSASSVQVVWDYGESGVTDSNANNNSTLFKIFGIEMVYVPGGSFYIGDGVNGTNGEFQWDASILGQVSDEVGTMVFAATVATANAWYYNTDAAAANDVASGTAFTIGTSFPKGWNAFYCMKYELSQGQYKDFLNTLTRAQQINRVASTINGDTITNVYVMENTSVIINRNAITAPASGNGTTLPVVMSTVLSGYDKGSWACNKLSWMDLCAYLDWAALRPMSELEYEKAARGPLYPVSGEYAWGSTSLTNCDGITGSPEDGTETCSLAGANAYFNNLGLSGGDTGIGQLRTGIYATASNNTRVLTGASYYGIMELTANVAERAVSVGLTAGRSFSGSHGDGVLTSVTTYEGNATNYDWPGLDATSNARGITGATGSGFRGGGWTVTTANMAARSKVSSRYNAGTTDTTRGSDYGGRGVRSVVA